jgi:glyoxylase-like metal-dependent hydrolase (beta-lactamase superfamily II)
MNQSLQDVVNSGDGVQPADDYGNGIYGAKGVANAYLVTSDAGDVQINTGLASTAREVRRRFSEVSSGPLKVIIFTQGHPDHVGGWSEFTGPRVETIAQANHADVREYWRRLRPFYGRRTARLWGQFRP